MAKSSLSPILYASLLANALFLSGLWTSRTRSAVDVSHGSVLRTANRGTTGNSTFQTDLTDGQCVVNFGNSSCQEQFPGHHQARLTHLIIPFHTSHVNRVENLLKQWRDYPPCSAEGDLNNAAPAAPFSLVFYSSTDMRKREKVLDVEQRIQEALQNLTAPVLRCFQGFEFHHANLSGPSDKYYRGTRLMIEKLLLGKVKLAVTPQYAYYMEPDVQPVRSNWLNALDASVRWPNQPFWMKGSIYRGNNKGVYATRHPPQYYHINGNAIYNLGDRAFRSFYVKHYRPFCQQQQQQHQQVAGSAQKPKERSYDTDFFRFLHSMEHVEVARNVFHKFVYTDVVQNFWRSSYSLAKIRAEHPNTHLVHGGYQKP